MISVDGSLFIQIANFLILIFILNIVLYRPIRKILIDRKEKINGLEQGIDTFHKDAQDKEEAFAKGIKDARADGLAKKDELLAEAAEQERLSAQRQSAMQRMIDEYVLYIKEKVQRSWIRPPSSGAELSCTVEVRLIPSGEVIDAKIVRSSGNAPFDRSVETAVFKASPLPVPPDPEVMEQFRTLRFEFNYFIVVI